MKPTHPIYLDYAAATPLDPAVLDDMLPWMLEKFHNPSSLYDAARKARLALEDSRHQVAQILGAKKTEIIFTAGGSESVNLAILGTARAANSEPAENKLASPYRVIATTIEHESVLASLSQLDREGLNTHLVPVERNGIVDPSVIASAVDDQTVLISIGYANSEIGTIQPIAKIGQLVAQVRANRQERGVQTPLYFHVDAAQATGCLDLQVTRLGVDLLSSNGSKIYGPKQTGCLYIRTGVRLQPIVFGGGQERGLRSGSESVAGAVGFAKALRLAQASRQSENHRLTRLRDDFIKTINTTVPGAILNGDPSKRLPGNINLSLPGVDGESIVLYLDQAGVQASTGSACAAGRSDPSHVLLAIGRNHDQANSSLRLTIGRSTTKAELDYLCEVLPGIYNRLSFEK